MTKAFVDELIHNMKLAGFVAKASPWMIEGIRDEKMNVRFIGLKLKDDWLEVFSEKDNLMLKFIIDRNTSVIEFYLANNTPFIKITQTQFSQKDKWETLLGEFRRRLKKDKEEFIHHNDKIGNFYKLIKPHLKRQP